MVPNTAYEPVSSFTKNWDVTGQGRFQWTLASPEPHSIKRMRIMQKALRFGMPDGPEPAVRHCASLRFRVSGRHIRPGAELWVGVPRCSSPPSDPVAYALPGTTAPDFAKLRLLRMPIFPTSKTSAATGAKIWETCVEVDAFQAYVLCLGGPSAKGMQGTDGVLAPVLALSEPAPAGHFDPESWNRHWVCVRNEDGSSSPMDVTMFQRLTIEPPGFAH
jgi:hypothetical protein